MIELSPQRHVEYVLDCESYSLIFRPRAQSTEVIQYTRYEYTPGNVDLVSSLIKENLDPGSSSNFSFDASFVLVFLMDSSKLETRKSGCGTLDDHWFVVDSETREVFDLAQGRFGPNELRETYARAERNDFPGFESRPTSELFDSLMAVQPTAKRYEVDEIITIANKAESEFLSYKSHMDYLFNLGVFGFNKK